VTHTNRKSEENGVATWEAHWCDHDKDDPVRDRSDEGKS
jgi:hypothetical protein